MNQSLFICPHAFGGLLELTGSDRLRFLHNQTTNNILSLKPTQGCETVFVNSTARTLDLATIYVTEDSCLILVSEKRREFLFSWMDRYIFPMDQVELKDISAQTAIITLIGDSSSEVIAQTFPEVSLTQEFDHCLAQKGSLTCRVALGSSLALPGYTLLVPQEQKAELWQLLTSAGAQAINETQWEAIRIQQGRPAPDQELTEDYNPLEAGLWHTISLNKGCYIGQETIARLHTYKGIKQRLWRISLPTPVSAQTPVTLNGVKVGVVTSCTPQSEGAFCLAYVKAKAGGEGTTVQVGETEGQLESPPFLYRGLELSSAVLDHS